MKRAKKEKILCELTSLIIEGPLFGPNSASQIQQDTFDILNRSIEIILEGEDDTVKESLHQKLMKNIQDKTVQNFRENRQYGSEFERVLTSMPPQVMEKYLDERARNLMAEIGK